VTLRGNESREFAGKTAADGTRHDLLRQAPFGGMAFRGLRRLAACRFPEFTVWRHSPISRSPFGGIEIVEIDGAGACGRRGEIL
jgi:hypothetical protein